MWRRVGFGWRADPEGRRSIRLTVMDALDSGHNETMRTTEQKLVLSNESQYTSDLGRMLSLSASWGF